MKIFLRGKKLFNMCINGWDKNAPEDVKTEYLVSNDEAIALMVARMNERCFNKVVNATTINSAHLLWSKIAQQYASHSIVNRGRVFMKWSALTYDGDLQIFINNMRSALCNIESVKIVIPPSIISYVILGKLMKIKELDQIVNKIALSEDSVETPYLVLDALQTYYTHNQNKSDIKNESSSATALMVTLSSLEFPTKTIFACVNGKHNPCVTSHCEARCFEKFPHLKDEACQRQSSSQPPRNTSASYAQATALVMITSKFDNNHFILDSAATHHMIRDRLLFTKFTPANIKVMTGNPDAPIFNKEAAGRFSLDL
jgi:hypothetical protein